MEAKGCGAPMVHSQAGTSKKIFIHGYSSTPKVINRNGLLLIIFNLFLFPNAGGYP